LDVTQLNAGGTAWQAGVPAFHMKLQYKIYIGIGVIVVLGIVGGAVWSDRHIAKLEDAVALAKQSAITIQQKAGQKEIEAAGHLEKIAYLESQLIEIQIIAREQDEELEKLSNNSGRARGDAKRARDTRSITASHAELCQKLAELGHGCE